MTARVVRLGAVDSTQTAAFALAADGAPDGTAVVADTQRAGRGRQGRAWEDEPGASLLVSLVVRPALPLAALPQLSLAAAVAVAEALAEAAGLPARLKWPNDVLVGGRKIAGILLESRLGSGRPVVVIGIGVNLDQRGFPLSLAGQATSVRLAGGRPLGREAALAAVLAAVDGWRARLEREGFAPVRERWRALADTLGRPVRVDDVEGTAVDLDADGALLVDTAGGRRRVVAGDVVVDAADAARA
ncbi:MAG TPA: biotin--[acetyl-CoA-carboxylase] ligase [Methylomirabilota bacterium]|nr:biotin--[acetyl-CoA-carboxylase] ligase [Methylomirabilota bacterium]